MVVEKTSKRWNLECKNQVAPAGRDAVSNVTGSKALYGVHYSAVVVNTSFHKSAYEVAFPNGVYLYDYECIDGWIREYCRKISWMTYVRRYRENIESSHSHLNSSHSGDRTKYDWL